jgi:hypothetical protein
MSELKTTQRYALRLTARFVDYAPDQGRILWREFPKDKIVVDRDTIEFLESHNAPAERIEIDPKLSP